MRLGYESAENSTDDDDIDGCAIHAEYPPWYECFFLSTCQDTDGSYECICDTGYEINDDVCEDIDDCQLQNDCDDTDGSFTCALLKSSKSSNQARCCILSLQRWRKRGQLRRT